MTKGLVLTTTIKHPVVSTLILPGQSELSDIQQVIKIGPWVKDTFNEGDWVKINYKRFVRPKANKSIKDGNEYNSTDLDYYIPLVSFAGDDYLEIDQGDVEYYWPKDSIEN